MDNVSEMDPVLTRLLIFTRDAQNFPFVLSLLKQVKNAKESRIVWKWFVRNVTILPKEVIYLLLTEYYNLSTQKGILPCLFMTNAMQYNVVPAD